MDHFFTFSFLTNYLTTAKDWLVNYVLVSSTLLQGAAIFSTLLLALLIRQTVKRKVTTVAVVTENRFTHLLHFLISHLFPLCWLGLLLFVLAIAARLKYPHELVKAATSLLAVWVVIDLTSSLFKSTSWTRFIAFAAWTLAALNILNLLGPTIDLFDSLAISFGHLRISLLTVMKGVFVLILLLWVAQSILQVFEKRIKSSSTLSPSLQVLSIKLLKVVLLTVAIVSSLGIVGIDLTSFTVFTGAVGVGIGFGLQKIISNLISGILLLLDKSIKPGDVITIGDTYGWINSLGARYVSLVTREGKEFLIPNEDLITHQVENWSFSDNAVRLKVPVGISYHADVRLAMNLCVEAAKENNRVIGVPEPVCLLGGFGDSSVDLELRFWIDDPINGLGNVKSQVLLAIWDKFHQHNIEIPFPQRDLHIRSPQPISFAAAGEEQP
ncbi:MAG: mechanosensitive ion channel [Deltaproteobacteria bacterium]